MIVYTINVVQRPFCEKITGNLMIIVRVGYLC